MTSADDGWAASEHVSGAGAAEYTIQPGCQTGLTTGCVV